MCLLSGHPRTVEVGWDPASLWLAGAMGGKDELTSFSLKSKGDTQ